jgi:hypothetical protein
VFIANVLRSRREGAVAGPDPWDASTLEWAADSPPKKWNFALLPTITSRTPLWTPPEDRGVVTGMRTDRREVLITTLTEARPSQRMVQPNSTPWPFLAALGFTIGLYGSVFAFSWYFISAALGTIGLVGWFWPRRPLEIDS